MRGSLVDHGIVAESNPVLERLLAVPPGPEVLKAIGGGP